MGAAFQKNSKINLVLPTLNEKQENEILEKQRSQSKKNKQEEASISVPNLHIIQTVSSDIFNFLPLVFLFNQIKFI